MSLDQFLLSADTTDLNYPEVRPTLDLNFARVKALDPRITFTRASGGSYVGADGLIKYAGVNEPRFDHDPVTGESLGFLVEESRTNLNPNSFDPTIRLGAGEPSTRGTLVYNVLDPFGAFGGVIQATLTRFPNPALTSWHRGSGNFFATAGDKISFSFFFNKGTLNNLDQNSREDDKVIGFQCFSPYDAQGIYITENYLNSQIQLPNGWVYCKGTFTAAVSGNYNLYVSLSSFQIGQYDGLEGTFYFTGLQLEAGAFPTSYIPTEGSTRTRAADEASITGKNFRDFYRQDEGVITCTYRSSKNSGNAFGAFVISNNTPDNRILHVSNGSAFAVGGLVITGGATQGNMSAGSSGGQGSSFKFGLGYKVNNFATTGNGSISTGTSGSIPTVDRLDFGFFYPGLSSSNILNGTIARLTYYPKRLTNQQLQVLTR